MSKPADYEVIISDRARQMLGAHMRFLAIASPAAAQKVKRELMAAIRSLSTLPKRYPFFDEDFMPPNKYHKLFVENWYLVLYQVKDKVVYVDYIVDCRQDYGWLLQ